MNEPQQQLSDAARAIRAEIAMRRVATMKDIREILNDIEGEVQVGQEPLDSLVKAVQGIAAIVENLCREARL